MIKSAYVCPPRADCRNRRPLNLPAQKDCSLAQLREYVYVAWQGEYYIRTGWGQDAGRVATEAQARMYCQYARECMKFSAVYLSDQEVPFGTECDILDLDVYWNTDERRLASRGKQFYARPGEWRFKIIMTQTFEEWRDVWDKVNQPKPLYETRVFTGGTRALNYAAGIWKVSPDAAREVIDTALRIHEIYMVMSAEEWSAWVEAQI